MGAGGGTGCWDCRRDGAGEREDAVTFALAADLRERTARCEAVAPAGVAAGLVDQVWRLRS
jgi:hypothetical protein